jgi:hypothetical protein
MHRKKRATIFFQQDFVYFYFNGCSYVIKLSPNTRWLRDCSVFRQKEQCAARGKMTVQKNCDLQLIERVSEKCLDVCALTGVISK